MEVVESVPSTQSGFDPSGVVPELAHTTAWSAKGPLRDAVLTQIWVAMCMYLSITYLKFMSKIGIGMQQICGCCNSTCSSAVI